jgi:hypothetical protein
MTTGANSADWRIAGARYCPSGRSALLANGPVSRVARDELPVLDLADVDEDDGLVASRSA